MFEGNRQQDAHELLHCLLDQLCHLPQDLKNRGSGENSSPQVPKIKRENLGPPDAKRARRRSERIQAQEDDVNNKVKIFVILIYFYFVKRWNKNILVSWLLINSPASKS